MTKKEVDSSKESHKSQVQKTHHIQKKEIKPISRNLGQTLEETRCALMAQIKKIFSCKANSQNSQIKLIQEAIQNCFEYNRMQDYNIVIVAGQQVDSMKIQIKKILLKKVNQNYKILKIPLKTQLSGIQVIQQCILQQILKIRCKKSFSTSQIIRQLKQSPYQQKVIIYIQDIQNLLKKKITVYTDSIFDIFSKAQKLNIMLFCVSNSLDEIKKRAEKFLNFDKIKNIQINSQTQQQILQIVNMKLKYIESETRAKVIISQQILLKIVKKCTSQQKGRLLKVFQILNSLIEKQLSNLLPQKNENFLINIYKYQINNKLPQSVKKIQQLKNLPLFQQIIYFTLYLQINKTDEILCQKSKIYYSAKPICNFFGAPFNYNFVNENLNILIDYGYVAQLDKKKKAKHSQKLRLNLSRKDIYKIFINMSKFAQLMTHYNIKE